MAGVSMVDVRMWTLTRFYLGFARGFSSIRANTDAITTANSFLIGIDTTSLTPGLDGKHERLLLRMLSID